MSRVAGRSFTATEGPCDTVDSTKGSTAQNCGIVQKQVTTVWVCRRSSLLADNLTSGGILGAPAPVAWTYKVHPAALKLLQLLVPREQIACLAGLARHSPKPYLDPQSVQHDSLLYWAITLPTVGGCGGGR